MTENDNITDWQVDDGNVASEGHDGKAETQASHRGYQSPIFQPEAWSWDDQVQLFRLAFDDAAAAKTAIAVTKIEKLLWLLSKKNLYNLVLLLKA